MVRFFVARKTNYEALSLGGEKGPEINGNTNNGNKQQESLQDDNQKLQEIPRKSQNLDANIVYRREEEIAEKKNYERVLDENENLKGNEIELTWPKVC